MPIDKPEAYPEWATNAENDLITNAANKLEPTEQFKLSGLKRRENLPRAFLNYQFDHISNWLKYLSDAVDNLSAIDPDLTSPLEQVYGVGSVYITTDSTNPFITFGFGSWSRIRGKMLIGVDESDGPINAAGNTGGSKSHTHTDNFEVVDHTLTTAEMPAHSHQISGLDQGTEGVEHDGGLDYGWDVTAGVFGSTTTVGGGAAHGHGISGGVTSTSTLPPYYAVYIWTRVS